MRTIDIAGIICFIPFLAIMFTYVIFIIAILFKEANMRDRFDNEGYVMSSRGGTFLGSTGGDLKEVNGLGVLILTEKVLHFELLIPKVIHDIPLSEITGADTHTSYLGKDHGKKVMLISHMMDGKLVSSGFKIKDVNTWCEDIEKRIEN